jgi:hypothetical protein
VSDQPLVAEIGCPRCGRLVASVLRRPDGGLTIKHRLPRGISDRDVENRPWTLSEVGDDPTGEYWACGCGDVSCGGLLVLEIFQVQQLVQRSAAHRNAPVRWTPTGAEIERSDRLNPYVFGHLYSRLGADEMQAMRRLRITEPPPLALVRRINRVRA